MGHYTASRGRVTFFLTKNMKGGLGDFTFMLMGIPPAHPPPLPPLKNECSFTKNYCVTWNIRVYANFMSNLLAYLISAVSP